MSNFRISKVAQNEEIPRDFFILSNSGNPEVAHIEEIPRDFFNLSNSGILRNAQNRLWLEGFGVCNSIGVAQLCSESTLARRIWLILSEFRDSQMY